MKKLKSLKSLKLKTSGPASTGHVWAAVFFPDFHLDSNLGDHAIGNRFYELNTDERCRLLKLRTAEVIADTGRVFYVGSPTAWTRTYTVRRLTKAFKFRTLDGCTYVFRLIAVRRPGRYFVPELVRVK